MLTMDHFRQLKDKLRESQKPSTGNTVFKRCKRMLRYAVERGAIATNPWEGGKHFPVRRNPKVFWRISECEKFLETVRAERADHFIFFAIALQTACRKSELFGIRKMDCDFDERVIRVSRQWDTDKYEFPEPGEPRRIDFKSKLKNGEPEKIIPMTDGLHQVLKTYCATVIGAETLLYYFTPSEMKNPGKILRHYAAKAGVPPIKMHSTRDSAIGNLKRAGVGDWLIARIAGCSIQNLRNYGDLELRDVRTAVENLSLGVR
jgi:integrase